MTQEQLSHTLFPLGNLEKDEIRKIAEKHNLHTSSKPDSQEICFIPDNKYAEFIKNFDKPNVVGYFEMDIENIIGYENVLELRKILESVSNKIIPVWHPQRGIPDYIEMCKKYAGKIIAIGGFRGTDIKDEQYLMFLKTAKKYNCKVHCLGMTRKKVLDKVPFDFTDSSTWLQQVNYGNEFFGNKKFAKAKGKEKEKQYKYNYLQGMKMQKHYYMKWRKECKD
jgi:hypothetical protein